MTEKKNAAEIVIIIDKSGSMESMGNEVVGGINSALKAAKENPESKVTLTFFDTEVTRKYDRISAREVSLLEDEDYIPDGMTALLDAVGQTVNSISKAQKEMARDERPEKTLVTIITDGMENASKEYTYDAIKKLIEKKEKKGWEFIFMGANIDAVSEAAKIGIASNRAAKWAADARGMQAASAVMAKSVGAAAMSMDIADEDRFAEIEEDWASR